MDYEKPIKVTVSDPETGDILGESVVANDYILICAGNRYLKSVQIMGRTHMLAVAVAKTEPSRVTDGSVTQPASPSHDSNKSAGT